MQPTVVVSIADNWQGRGRRFGVALNSRWVFMVFSFTDQPNFMAAHVDLVLHFFESLLNKNTTCEVGMVGIIKSLKMATLNSSREAATTFFIAL